MPSYTLNVNGRDQQVTVSSSGMPLRWVLRDVLALTGTKYGCGIEICGACTVLVNGQPEKSCDMDVSSAVGKRITTIESVAQTPVGQKVQAAWRAVDVPQCGYCQSGQIMAAAALLKQNPRPTDKDIDAAMTNICRCGTYQRIREAVHMAAGGATTGTRS